MILKHNITFRGKLGDGRLLGLKKTHPVKRNLLKTSLSLLLICFIGDATASDEFNENGGYSIFRGSPQQRSSHYLNRRDMVSRAIEDGRRAASQRKLDEDSARSVINGVIAMYKEDANFRINVYNIETRNIIDNVNASYTHATRTFDLPQIRQRNRAIVRTAQDQGIVSHEAGHMILHYLYTFYPTAYTNAFHEAFADLTAHFYRFYNERSRQDFMTKLRDGQGCVGDNHFTCVRNNAQSITLYDLSRNENRYERHELSKPFSNAVYNNMVTSYYNGKMWFFQDDGVAQDIVKWHKRTLVRTILSLRAPAPTLMDIARKMLEVSYNTPAYREGLGQNFIKNGLISLIYSSPSPRSRTNPRWVYSQNEKFLELCLTGRAS